MLTDAHLRRTYGITQTQYKIMLNRQGGVCAICRRKPRSNQPDLAVDHDHLDGLVRGLLCARCNHGLLGYFGETIEIYTSAADYLTNPPAVDQIGHHYVPDSRGAEGDLDHA